MCKCLGCGLLILVVTTAWAGWFTGTALAAGKAETPEPKTMPGDPPEETSPGEGTHEPVPPGGKQQLDSLCAEIHEETGLEVRCGDRRVTLVVRNLFKARKPSLSAKGCEHLRRLAAFAKIYNQLFIVVESHTDSMGSSVYNRRVSKTRANAVRAFLLQKMNLPEERVRAVGSGEEKPIADKRTSDGRQTNRRIEIHFVIEPGADAGASK